MIIQHHLQLLRYYRYPVAIFVIVATLISAGLSALWLFTSPTYTGSVSVLITPTEAEYVFMRGAGTGRRASGGLAQTYMEYIKSRPVVEAALDRINALSSSGRTVEVSEEEPSAIVQAIRGIVAALKRTYRILDSGTYIELPEREKEVQELIDAIDLDKIQDSFILKINVDLEDAQAAATAANALADAYVARVTQQLAAAATELEDFFEKQIKLRRGALGRLAAREREAVEEEIFKLQSRMLAVSMSRSSAFAQVRVIDPAIIPRYPSSPQVLRNTFVAFVASILFSVFGVVAISMLSNTLRTGADLERLVGSRALGYVRGAWLFPNSARSFRQLSGFGKILEQRLTVLGDLEGQVIQVTGMLASVAVLATARSMAVALASGDREVRCRLPGTRAMSGDFELVREGYLTFVDEDFGIPPTGEIRIEAVGPLSPELDLAELAHRSPILICALPVGEISEQIVQAFRVRAREAGLSAVSFVLVES